MPDLEQRLRGIDHLPVPDLWERANIQSLEHRSTIQPSAGRRAAIMAAALVLSVAALWLLRVAFRPDLDHQPVTTPVSMTNGDVWVWVDAGSKGTMIDSVDPEHPSDRRTEWTDSSAFTRMGARNAPERVARDYVFSPDGTQVAFSAQTGNGPLAPRELFVMNVDGSRLRQLTYDAQYADLPAWSPDGSTIAYGLHDASANVPGCFRYPLCASDLYVVPAGGGASMPLAADPMVSEEAPSWSPDGTRIAFAVDVYKGPSSIAAMRLDGTDRLELATGQVSSPAWSPDSASIAFSRIQDRTMRIWTIAPDGSGARELVDTRIDRWYYPSRAVWSPDGTSIAFARPSSGVLAIWVIGANGDAAPEGLYSWPTFDSYPIAWRPIPVSRIAG